jgi:hypothetical protein
VLRSVKAIVLGGLAAGALLVAGAPASAAPAHQAGQLTSTKVVALSSKSVTPNIAYSCFGYTGNFKSDRPVEADWNGDGVADECFGISPGRNIYHAWPGSGGWKVMPNNGKADYVSDVGFLDGYRTVVVLVASTGNFYCSSLIGTWQPWWNCA